jgi:hypothetical protein
MTTFKNQSGIVLRGYTSNGDVLSDCSDMLIIGRAYKSLPGLTNNYGLSLTRCKNVRVLDCDFEGFGRGIVASMCDGFDFTANRFSGMKIDGINLAQCWRGVVSDNDFIEPDTGEAHPDAIQMWSRPTMRQPGGAVVPAPPTSDIVIARNRVRGMLTQGITAFNHVREGVDDGGYDRITIVDNEIEVGMPQALALYAGRNCAVLRNRVSTFPEATSRASINLVGCTGLVRRNNTVGAGAGKGPANDPT